MASLCFTVFDSVKAKVSHLALMLSCNLGFRGARMTVMFTPALSKTLPPSIMHVMPPPSCDISLINYIMYFNIDLHIVATTCAKSY